MSLSAIPSPFGNSFRWPCVAARHKQTWRVDIEDPGRCLQTPKLASHGLSCSASVNTPSNSLVMYKGRRSLCPRSCAPHCPSCVDDRRPPRFDPHLGCCCRWIFEHLYRAGLGPPTTNQRTNPIGVPTARAATGSNNPEHAVSVSGCPCENAPGQDPCPAHPPSRECRTRSSSQDNRAGYRGAPPPCRSSRTPRSSAGPSPRAPWPRLQPSGRISRGAGSCGQSAPRA